MKNTTFLLFLLGTLFQLCSCIEHYSAFQTSKKAWLDFKAASDNSYQYTVNSSSWVGWHSETVITVENGVVTQRGYEFTPAERPAPAPPPTTVQWTEVGAEVGAHEEAAEPLTLDEVYELAQEKWLVRKSGQTSYFHADHNGIISSCGYVRDNCADDCSVGIRISNIVAL